MLAEFIPNSLMHRLGTLANYLLISFSAKFISVLLLIFLFQKENDKQKPFVIKYAFHDFQSQKYDCLWSSLFLKLICW